MHNLSLGVSFKHYTIMSKNKQIAIFILFFPSIMFSQTRKDTIIPSHVIPNNITYIHSYKRAKYSAILMHKLETNKFNNLNFIRCLINKYNYNGLFNDLNKIYSLT